MLHMDTEYFAQRIQCSRNDKQECLQTIYIMAEFAFTTHGGGIHAMDDFLAKSRTHNAGAFLMNAIQIYMDTKNVNQLRTVLYNSIICSNLSGPQFLNAVIITEVLAALREDEDIDFIFSFLIPSFFGIDFEDTARQAFQNYRRVALLRQHDTNQNEPEN
ncbi:MAG TPA: hypothetical protein DHW78_01160 [Ruminococcaceae bacterium]|nr:hypothetical protein [Oscillospiraceae bacterium]HCA71159.1 hypothetical protein [Oscillospiraceae bacterium]HCC01421.1 hypothetical protein [Oscillospiraceae bacterium]HCM22923.1 hypothetical protein [Oscillospiraceae bacterium]